jgi:hypothetical protein
VSAVLARTLMEIDPRYPKVDAVKRKELADTRAMLEAEAPKGAAPDPFETQLAAGQQEAGQQSKQARKQRERMAKIRAKAARA